MSELEKLLMEMGGIGEPWELFEPYLFKDKLGESQWYCEVRSVDAILWVGSGQTPLEAVKSCYEHAKPPEYAPTAIKESGE